MNAIIARYIEIGCPLIIPNGIVELDNVNVLLSPRSLWASVSLLRLVMLTDNEEMIQYVVQRSSLDINDYEIQDPSQPILFDRDPSATIMSILTSGLSDDTIRTAIRALPADRLSECMYGRSLALASIVGPDVAIAIADKISDYEGKVEVESRYSVGEDTI